MPALPSLTLATQGEVDAVLAHFADTDQFILWLANAVQAEVERRAMVAADAQVRGVREAAMEVVRAETPSLTEAATVVVEVDDGPVRDGGPMPVVEEVEQ